MAPTTKKQRSATDGAPSQFQKTGRKGKNAWRKNVNIEDVETGLEEIRKEEQVLGVSIQKQPDAELFTVDASGDAAIRKSLPPRLTHAQKILAARSAIPSPYPSSISPTPENAVKRRAKISYQEKQRLHRIAGRSMRGPFGALVDPRAESREGVGLALEKSATDVDLWAREDEEQVFLKSLEDADQKEYLPDLVLQPKFKPPRADSRHRSITLKAVSDPHAGSSYNPSADAHQALLRAAVEVEERREDKRLRIANRRQGLIEMAKKVERDQGGVEVVPETGMVLDVPDADMAEPEDGDDAALVEEKFVRKDGKRKTKRAINQEKRTRAEQAARLVQARRRKLMHSINFTKQLTQTVQAQLAVQELGFQRNLERRRAQYQNGLAGKRLGSKYVVPRGEIDVQLTEDLSESLRRMKVEGNLFRDRMINLQQRGKIEALSSRTTSRKSKAKWRVVEKRRHKEFV